MKGLGLKCGVRSSATWSTTRKTPRLLIREDFPNGVVTELVGMAE
jgi:hypothetical protein